MTMTSINEVFKKHLKKYLTANKAGKGKLLEHVCFVTELQRKSAIRKFGRLQMRSSNATANKRRGRPIYYTGDVTLALKDIWLAASGICGELVHPIIAEYVAILKRDDDWKHGEETTKKLLAMSEMTVKRRVTKFMAGNTLRKGISATKPSKLKEIIPIFTGPWKGKPPGFGQLDSVAHCGDRLIGDFAWSINWTDVATLWGSRRAQWNKGKIATQKSLEAIRDKLPFAMLGAHPDTGSEFINWLMQCWCEEQGIELTRSRPYHKDDNAYVEQKNGHVIRRFLKYVRFDNKDVVDLMNELYNVLDVYLNHFVPSRKLLKKERIGSKYKKVYDKGRAPYWRVLESPDIPDDMKTALRLEHEGLNPLYLKREVDTLIAKIFKKQREGERQG